MKYLILTVLCLLLAVPAMAEDNPDDNLKKWKCPLKVKCKQHYVDLNGNTSNQTVGEIEIKESCYSFPVGCRPWHCDGNHTTAVHYYNRCNNEIPDCTRDHAHMTDPECLPHFLTY